MDLVKLENVEPYIDNGLKQDMHGVVLNVNQGYADVLFFNPQNIGDYIVVKVNIDDMVLEKEKLPEKVQESLLLKLENNFDKTKNVMKKLSLKAYDLVELIFEDEKYSKDGAHKGDRGCVMEDYVIGDYVLVDFSRVDNEGNISGKCIPVKIDDLKIV